jgi:steroid delta-isomerase-like uncharacterized protein
MGQQSQLSHMVEQFVADLFATWNAHDIERMLTFYAPDYEGTDVSQAQLQQGTDGVRAMFERIVRGFPDVQFSLDQTIVQDSRIVLVWTARGTHRGHIMNIPPTGRTVAARGVSVLNIRNGKITKGLYIWDVAAIIRGIGLLPEL